MMVGLPVVTMMSLRWCVDVLWCDPRSAGWTAPALSAWAGATSLSAVLRGNSSPGAAWLAYCCQKAAAKNSGSLLLSGAKCFNSYIRLEEIFAFRRIAAPFSIPWHDSAIVVDPLFVDVRQNAVQFISWENA
jgi:hypothetical protein